MGFRDKFMAKSPFNVGSPTKAGNMKSPANEGKKSSMSKVGEMDPMANMGNSMAKKADPYAKALKKDSKLPDYIKQRKGLKKGTPEYAKVQNKINAAYGVSKRHSTKPASTTTTKPASDKKVELKPTVKAPSADKPANAGGEKKSTPTEPKTKFEKKTDKKIRKAVGKGKMEKAAKISAIASQPGNTGLEKRLNYKAQKARDKADERKADKEKSKAAKEARKTTRETKDGVKTVKKFDKQGNLKKTKTKVTRKKRKSNKGVNINSDASAAQIEKVANAKPSRA